MKYRIKITTFTNGRKEYMPEYKKGLLWKFIDWKGKVCDFQSPYNSREDALKNIDLHFAGNSKKQTIEFEYIKK